MLRPPLQRRRCALNWVIGHTNRSRGGCAVPGYHWLRHDRTPTLPLFTYTSSKALLGNPIRVAVALLALHGGKVTTADLTVWTWRCFDPRPPMPQTE